MKKLIFALPFLLFSITGCSNTTVGKVTKLPFKEVTSITIEEAAPGGPNTYVVSDEYVTEIASKISNFSIEVLSSPCKCFHPFTFKLTISETTYRFNAYSFEGGGIEIYCECDIAAYEDLVHYAIERS